MDRVPGAKIPSKKHAHMQRLDRGIVPTALGLVFAMYRFHRYVRSRGEAGFAIRDALLAMGFNVRVWMVMG